VVGEDVSQSLQHRGCADLRDSLGILPEQQNKLIGDNE